MSNQDFLTQPHGVVGVLGQEAKYLVGEEFLEAYDRGETVFKFWVYGEEKEDTPNIVFVMRAYKAWLREGKPLSWKETMDIVDKGAVSYLSVEKRKKKAEEEVRSRLTGVVYSLWQRDLCAILQENGYDSDLHKRGWIGHDLAQEVVGHILTTIYKISDKYGLNKPPLDPALARICEAYWVTGRCG